jgi:hypothetical protein
MRCPGRKKYDAVGICGDNVAWLYIRPADPYRPASAAEAPSIAFAWARRECEHGKRRHFELFHITDSAINDDASPA